MKAAVLFDYGDLRVTEVPVPDLGPGDVLVKVHSVAIWASLSPAMSLQVWLWPLPPTC